MKQYILFHKIAGIKESTKAGVNRNSISMQLLSSLRLCSLKQAQTLWRTITRDDLQRGETNSSEWEVIGDLGNNRQTERQRDESLPFGE